jgi:endonuclease/exonuclease/phosphatase family metal-dependent hydrolase
MNSSENEINLLSWNIKAGGFDAYDPSLQIPSREKDIVGLIDFSKDKYNTDTVILTDAYRWDEVYGDDNSIAHHLGFSSSAFTRLEDARLLENNGAGIGIAIATDQKVERQSILDLETRLGLSVILDIGRHGLQVAGVYLDDLKEETRERQITALLGQLESDIPTVIAGDFNMLRPKIKSVSLRSKLADTAVRAVAPLLPNSELGRTIKDMNKRKTYTHIVNAGYVDNDPHMTPTSPSVLPVFGLDYVFTNDTVKASDFTVVRTKASDHSALATILTV